MEEKGGWDYAIVLQKAIGYHTQGKAIPEDLVKRSPFLCGELNRRREELVNLIKEFEEDPFQDFISKLKELVK